MVDYYLLAHLHKLSTLKSQLTENYKFNNSLIILILSQYYPYYIIILTNIPLHLWGGIHKCKHKQLAYYIVALTSEFKILLGNKIPNTSHTTTTNTTNAPPPLRSTKFPQNLKHPIKETQGKKPTDNSFSFQNT